MDIFLTGALIAIAFLIRLPFFLQSGNLIDFDEATFALMAQHVLRGEFPIYIWGHSYSGSLDAFILAPFLAVLGTKPIAVKLASFILFSIFVALNYFLLKKLFSRPAALFASLLVLVMPPGVLDISMRIWGGHAELWPFAAALLMLLVLCFDPFRDGAKRPPLLFLIGCVSGIALWLSSLFLLFLLPYLIFFLFRFRKGPKTLRTGLANAFCFTRAEVPRAVRWAFVSLHCFLVFFLLMQAVGMFRKFFQGIGIEPLLQIFTTNPPFRVKEMRIIGLILACEFIFRSLLATPVREERLIKIKSVAIAAAGFLLGYFPALLFRAMGGRGLRIFYKSGAISFPDIPLRLRDVFLEKIPHFVLGFSQRHGPWDWLFPLLLAGVASAAVIAYRKDIRMVWRTPGASGPSYAGVFLLIAIVTVLANLASTLEAVRYMAPLYLALASLAGAFLGQIVWRRSKVLALMLAGLIAGNFLYADFRFYEGLPKNRMKVYEDILDYLQARGIRGGFAPRGLSHILTFISGENVVFAATWPKERYFPHEQYASGLKRKAWIALNREAADIPARRDQTFAGRQIESRIIGKYVIRLIEDTDASGKSSDGRYLDGPAKQHPRLYLNPSGER